MKLYNAFLVVTGAGVLSSLDCAGHSWDDPEGVFHLSGISKVIESRLMYVYLSVSRT